MYTKNTIASIIILLSIMSVWMFALPMKEQVLDPLSSEFYTLQETRDKYSNNTIINNLKQKVNSLNVLQVRVLENYVPKQLKSGTIIYTVSQFAQQNSLVIKNIQYGVSDVATGAPGKKLTIEMQFEGFYENFATWLRAIELADTLIDVESIRAAKINNSSEILSINVKMSIYGISID